MTGCFLSDIDIDTLFCRHKLGRGSFYSCHGNHLTYKQLFVFTLAHRHGKQFCYSVNLHFKKDQKEFKIW